ncbi:hypothetical protein AMTRI_Chr06g195700 [Amborella trichopoda]
MGLVSTIFLVFVFFTFDLFQTGGDGSLQPQQCEPACETRCSATQYHKACMTYCMYCCTRCLCVPSGTYGHKDECPCYRDMKTKEGKPKCP